jgi:hypothetical protein
VSALLGRAMAWGINRLIDVLALAAVAAIAMTAALAVLIVVAVLLIANFTPFWTCTSMNFWPHDLECSSLNPEGWPN